jgi:hypothetical protein
MAINRSNCILPTGDSIADIVTAGQLYGIYICTSTTRPSSPFEGQHIYETDTDADYKYDGSDWVELGGGGGLLVDETAPALSTDLDCDGNALTNTSEVSGESGSNLVFTCDIGTAIVFRRISL